MAIERLEAPSICKCNVNVKVNVKVNVNVNDKLKWQECYNFKLLSLFVYKI